MFNIFSEEELINEFLSNIQNKFSIDEINRDFRNLIGVLKE